MTLDITSLVKNNFVEFEFYRQGNLYYILHQLVGGDECGPIYDNYQFSIPVEDVGTATLLHKEKAIFFMRWIRTALMSNTLIKIKN